MKSRSMLFPAVAALLTWALPAAAQTGPGKEEAAPAPEAEAPPAEATAAEATPAEATAEHASAEDQATTVTTATISEVRAGSRVFDTAGAAVGTVESVDENGAVVSTGSVRARLPFSSFGKNDRGLVISMSRAQLEAEVAARTPS
jgi:hypothetical protein